MGNDITTAAERSYEAVSTTVTEVGEFVDKTVRVTARGVAGITAGVNVAETLLETVVRPPAPVIPWPLSSNSPFDDLWRRHTNDPSRSFAPVRNECTAKWFVNGESYMSAVADAIEQAKHEILITDWMFSAQIFLRRTAKGVSSLDDPSRLDKLLLKKADEGVKVFLLIFHGELKITIPWVERSGSYLKVVQPKPDWTDLPDWPGWPGPPDWPGWPGWPGPTDWPGWHGPPGRPGWPGWPGWPVQYGRLVDERLQEYIASLDWWKYPGLRPCWITKFILDLGNGESKKLLNHPNIVFILAPKKNIFDKDTLMWTHHEKTMVVDQNLAFVSGIDLCYGRWDNHLHHLVDNHHKPTKDVDEVDADVHHQTWIGLDYMNDFKAGYKHEDFKTPFKDYIDRSEVPRLPWHDIACCVQGKVAQDVAQHFKQRYEFSKTYQDKHEYKDLSPLDHIQGDCAIPISDPSTSDCTCQVLRSVSKWSAGVETEQSIYHAYISAIENAEHYVYIENQFFISSLDYTFCKVHNGIAEAIRKRIARAYKEKKKFRVILLIPLKPEFTGEFLGSDSHIQNIYRKLKNFGSFSIQDILNAELLTISRGDQSIFQKLIKKDGVPEREISNYFSIYGLRAYENAHIGDEEIPVTEIIYIHSKCMIVDDKITIIGSANINDRSMLGDRDSEMVIRFEDQTFVEGVMDGVPYKAGEFARSLRLHLFREYLGLQEDEIKSIQDPVSDEFYENVWKKTAQENNERFKEVFGGRIVPVDGVKTYEELEEHKKKKGLVDTDLSQAKHMLERIRGTLVDFPLDFLESTDMAVSGSIHFEPLSPIMYLHNPNPQPDEQFCEQ